MSPQPIVFIVDDDKAVRDAVHLLCEAHGLQVESYASAQAFLDSYAPDREGCLVLDICMPKMDGLELQAHLAAHQIELPIIFITAYSSNDKVKLARNAGALDILEKPFQPDVLIDRIRTAFKSTK
ncbi:response regulator transcription factor [Nitrosococcus wardiae]|uniref:Response regulator n=1 Tax=Nitrosococcus wardiae TaxID=1814290 RepID=A0A4P7BW83_9GAMM|nr:response regulator [Nitrosococcus wardiae]QBQ54201.1 response regulator [Nitrosococcus wardiae]